MDSSSTPPFALHEACRQGNLSLAEQLIKEAPKQANVTDGDGRLPIHWATSSNNAAIVQLLSELRGFDADAQDGSGWSPLMIAANVQDSEEVLGILLRKDPDVNQKNHNGQTALHLVASKNRLDYPIHRAAAVGSTPMITLLLEHKSPLDATDSTGYTALHHAIAEGHGDAAVTLLKAGADSTKRDRDGLLAIDLAPDREVRRYIQRMAENEGIEL